MVNSNNNSRCTSGDEQVDENSNSRSGGGRTWLRVKDPRIVRVSSSGGGGVGKDRHSKVCTIRGLRDRRVRLSVPTAIQLYDLQARLGLTQPSKAVDWLLDAAKSDIDLLPPLPFFPSISTTTTTSTASFINYYSQPHFWHGSTTTHTKLRGGFNHEEEDEDRDVYGNDDNEYHHPSPQVDSFHQQQAQFHLGGGQGRLPFQPIILDHHHTTTTTTSTSTSTSTSNAAPSVLMSLSSASSSQPCYHHPHPHLLQSGAGYNSDKEEVGLGSGSNDQLQFGISN